jgi:hypothetical protein
MKFDGRKKEFFSCPKISEMVYIFPNGREKSEKRRPGCHSGQNHILHIAHLFWKYENSGAAYWLKHQYFFLEVAGSSLSMAKTPTRNHFFCRPASSVEFFLLLIFALARFETCVAPDFLALTRCNNLSWGS